eukprot:1705861-Rhodomonas_salina.1
MPSTALKRTAPLGWTCPTTALMLTDGVASCTRKTGIVKDWRAEDIGLARRQRVRREEHARLAGVEGLRGERGPCGLRPRVDNSFLGDARRESNCRADVQRPVDVRLDPLGCKRDLRRGCLLLLDAQHCDVAGRPEEVRGPRGDLVRLPQRCHLPRSRVERQAAAEPRALQERIQVIVVLAAPAEAHSSRALHIPFDAKARALVDGPGAAEGEARLDRERGSLDGHVQDRRLGQLVERAQRVRADLQGRAGDDRGFNAQIDR